MSAHFEMPSHDALITEQMAVQADKVQERTLAQYNEYIFPGQFWPKPLGSAVVDLVRPLVGDAERVMLDDVLCGLSQAKAGEQVHWVDMGGGRALPMRQLGSTADFSQRLKMTNVDLFNVGLDGLKPAELTYLEGLAAGMTGADAEPAILTDNIETVTLPEPADIITSVEAIQYLNNPLGAITNWYNQLADDGIMIVATEHRWAGRMCYNRELDKRGETLAKHLLETLSEADIIHAATKESDQEDGYRPKLDPDCIEIMAIQKKPGTLLRVANPVTRIWANDYGYKTVYYDAPIDGRPSAIEVIKGDTPATLGAITLGKM